MKRCLSVTLLCSLAAGPAARAQSRCPDTKYLPQLTIRDITAPAVPVIDKWQVFLDDVPLSDFQVAQMAHHDVLMEELGDELAYRPPLVFLGMLTLASGAVLASTGWYLLGADDVSREVSLPLALGGIVLGIGGLLFSTTTIQDSVGAHLAPTPEHRLSREQARALVTRVNRRWYEEICLAAEVEGEGP